MMRLKILVPIAGPLFSYSPGDEVDYKDTKDAKRLIKAGFAKPIGKSKPVKAVKPALPEKAVKPSGSEQATDTTAPEQAVE